jgi:hypothetical protein
LLGLLSFCPPLEFWRFPNFQGKSMTDSLFPTGCCLRDFAAAGFVSVPRKRIVGAGRGA